MVSSIGVDYHQYVRIIENDCIYSFLRREESNYIKQRFSQLLTKA